MSTDVIICVYRALRNCSIALRMNVLLGTSPRTLSARFTKDIGNVIPTFSVLSCFVVPTLLVLYIVPLTDKHFLSVFLIPLFRRCLYLHKVPGLSLGVARLGGRRWIMVLYTHRSVQTRLFFSPGELCLTILLICAAKIKGR